MRREIGCATVTFGTEGGAETVREGRQLVSIKTPRTRETISSAPNPHDTTRFLAVVDAKDVVIVFSVVVRGGVARCISWRPNNRPHEVGQTISLRLVTICLLIGA